MAPHVGLAFRRSGVPEVDLKVTAGISIFAFIAVSWVLGLRLLSLARTTRQAPELCMGASLLLIGGFGYPLAIVSNVPAVQASIWGAFSFTACTWSVHVAVMATFLFVYFVFRRGIPLVRAAMWVAGALLLLTGVAQTRLAFSHLSRDELMAANILPATGLMTLAVLSYLWSAIESLRYWGLMRRRAAIGLADPVATNRFLLWGIAGSAMVIGAGSNLFASIATPLSVLHPLALLVTSICGFTNSTALVLTFVPPARYTSWVRGSQLPQA
jgi:hypothetical protein